MAELGDYIQQGATSTKEVTIEMMDYKYVEDCEDPAELRSILKSLRGKEAGHFPHLETTIENKLMRLLPEKERKKVIALRTGPGQHEVSEAGAALSAWTEKVRVDDKAIEEANDGNISRPLPPIRGQKGAVKMEKKAPPKSEPQPPKNKTPSAHVYDAPDYFRKWDAYDAEAEEQAIEHVDTEAQREADRLTKAHQEKEKGRAARREAELAELRGSMSWASMTPVQRNRFSMLEKNKGNECFKAGEPEEAMHFYSRALALIEEDHEQACVLWANRAMAALKVGLLERAEEDCTKAILLNPDYHKARLRRGMTRHKRGKYHGAVEDFDWLINAGTSIEDIAKLRERSWQKHLEVEGDSSKVKIVEVGSSLTVPLNDGTPTSLDSNLWERRPFQLPDPKPAQTFTKIAINVDDDSSEEEEEESHTEEGMSRVVITEDDDDEANENFVNVSMSEGEDTMSEWDAAKLKQKGVELFMRSHYKEATDVFHQALQGVESAAVERNQPVSSVFGNLWHNLRNNLAACALATEQWAVVVEHCDAVLEDQSTNLKALLRRAEARERLGLKKGACSDLQAALRIDPTNVEAAERLKLLSSSNSWSSSAPAAASEAAKLRGNDAMTRGAWSEAWALYTDALAHDPANVAARNNRCMCALKQQRWTEAEADASGVLKLSPENAKALFRRACARKELQNWKSAESDLLTALVVEPTNIKSQELLEVVRMEISKKTVPKTSKVQIIEEDEPTVEDIPRSTEVSNNRNEKAEEGTKVQIVDEDESEEEEEKRTKVQIVDEDESEEEEEKGTKVQIVDEDESEDEEEKGTKVQIVDEDENEEEEENGTKVQIVEDESEEEEKGTKVQIVDEDESEEEEEKGTKVQIVEDDSESDGEFSPYRQEATMRSEDCKLKGNQAMSEGDFILAEKCYTQSLMFDESNMAARNNRSVAYLKLGEFSQAEKDSTMVLLNDPNNLKALMRRAEARVGLNTISDAVKDLEKILVIDPSNEEAQGRLALAKGETSTEVSPSRDRAASDKEKGLGNDCLGKGALQEAEAHYTRAIKLDDSNIAAYNNRALCRLKQQKFEECLEDATVVIDSDTQNTKALLRRSQAFEKLGEDAKAQADVVAVLAIDQKHKEANARLSQFQKHKSIKEVHTPSVAVSSDDVSPQTPPHKPATPVRNIKVKVKVPKEPPSSITELERTWRELKNNPQDIAAYLKLFKSSTFKKLFKESISPDIIPQLLAVVNKQLANSTEGDPSAALRVLKGLTKSKCFSLTLMLLSPSDRTNVQEALDFLQDTKHRSDVQELKTLYGI